MSPLTLKAGRLTFEPYHTHCRAQVELPLFHAGIIGQEAKRRAAAALARVSLSDRIDHRSEMTFSPGGGAPPNPFG
ncbi:MAG: hypothetical protein R6W76_16545 [Caldilinea sp.]